MTFPRYGRTATMVLLAQCLMALPVPAAAESLVAQTRLRLSVLHLDPRTGEFERWEALDSELVVSPAQTVFVPLLGTLSVENLSVEMLATEVSLRLKTQIGLIHPVQARVEVLDYPPIYVVGAVSQPGEYRFRTDMTVLMAFALGGGALRPETGVGGDRVRLEAELRGAQARIHRSEVRLERLAAEFDPNGDTPFPAGPAENQAMGDLLAQEQAIFMARNSALDRQVAALTDLAQLYRQEIETLQLRVTDIDASLASAETELAGIRSLVDSGLATVSRRSELERLLSSMRADRLDQVVAMMRARQMLNEAERNMVGLDDQRRTDVAQQLQAEQAELEHLRLLEATTIRLIADFDALGPSDQPGQPGLIFTILRTADGTVTTLPAEESTLLRPADVLKVEMSPALPGSGSPR